MMDYDRLKAQAKKQKIRVTKNVSGKRVPLTEKELRAALRTNYDSAMENNFSNIENNAKSAVREFKKNGNVFYNAENELNNVFFNANNSAFELRDEAKNAIDLKFKNKLINNAYPEKNKKLKESAVRFATKIRNMVMNKNLPKAVATLTMLLQVVYLHQNPRFMNNQINQFGRVPFLRAIFRKGDGLFARSLSAFGASPTEAQAIYETVMATIPGNAYDRSVAGVFTTYLTMVVLSLISMLPWESTRGISFAVLKFIFRQLELLFPSVAKTVFKVVVERKRTSVERGKSIVKTVSLTKTLLPLIVQLALKS
jgi:hypothetical protein